VAGDGEAGEPSRARSDRSEGPAEGMTGKAMAEDGPDRPQEFQERQRVRLVYSLRDFQIALSAATFLSECEPEKKYSKVELRRFRCYETEMIMAYTRPFSQAHGEIPRLTLEMSGAQLTNAQKELHEDLIMTRNKIVAHSDGDMMRLLSTTAPITLGRHDFKFIVMGTAFDEGLGFIGVALYRVTELISLVRGAIFEKVLLDAQKHPERFEFRKDYLNK
jgi:hypothetical protein